MSIFTYHLIEALSGHAQPEGGASEVLVTEVMTYVSRRVPESVLKQHGAVQEPDFRLTGQFPVALLLGGKGIVPGQKAPDPLEQPTTPHSAPANVVNQLAIGNRNTQIANAGNVSIIVKD
jgi:hypothetical protein